MKFPYRGRYGYLPLISERADKIFEEEEKKRRKAARRAAMQLDHSVHKLTGISPAMVKRARRFLKR